MEPGGIRQRRLLSPTLPSNQRFEGVFFFSLPVRNERGESRREGPSGGITPPLPDPLLPPASGREGEAGSPGGYGAQGAHLSGEFFLHSECRRGCPEGGR